MSEETGTVLRLVQIGDLHITDAGLQNRLDLRRIIDEVNGNTGGNVDFAHLPGDNADDGTAEQFRIVRYELSRLIAPRHAIPGEHDFNPRSLETFYRGLQVADLPYDHSWPPIYGGDDDLFGGELTTPGRPVAGIALISKF